MTYAVLDTEAEAAQIIRTTREGLRTTVPADVD